jgi:hypothetical protein
MNDMAEFGYTINNYCQSFFNDERPLFVGFRPFSYSLDIINGLDALLSADDPYRNDREVHTVYYPYIPPYNQDLIAEQNHVYDTYDPERIPDFNANVAAGID